MPASPAAPVLARADAALWRSRQTGTVVFTNGVFELIHPGHIDLLTAARAEGDVLVVALNTDASVRRLGKGADRPMRAERDRAYVVSALRVVSAVVLFDEDTPRELIAELQPDVLVKGGDYDAGTVVGADIVRERGGRVVIVPLTPGQSTTSIVESMKHLKHSDRTENV
jgi:D-beta-D-heptose 7-phosphate kinase/D-beta-D-heptose 1-phosphate adenosyltransferase